MVVLAALALAEEAKKPEEVKKTEDNKDSKTEKRGLFGLGYGYGGYVTMYMVNISQTKVQKNETRKRTRSNAQPKDW